ncbi:MAG TPA: TAXI family TRAP transporter solute-binding subunit, partial [Hyphomicrobiaceae bacterium]|nr:TAXI family TRAP transporter solute-binding subunit [Hyphomicrobiaceae bacterium]
MRQPTPLSRLSGLQLRELVLVVGPALLAVLLAVVAAARFVEPAPPMSLIITTGGEKGGYFAFGRRYAQILAKSGVKLVVEPSAGSIENIKRLGTPEGRWSVALLQGGIADAKTAPDVLSLGRIFLEPLWVFYRSADSLDRLAQLKGQRIAIGPEGSGTRQLAVALLSANAITETTATLLPLSGQEAADALDKGAVDAVFLVLAPEAPLIQALLRSTSVKLMSLSQSEAYTRRFPYLSKIVLPRGVVDLVANIPAQDVEMV